VTTIYISLYQAHIEEIKDWHKNIIEIVKENKVVNLLWMLPIPTISDAAYNKLATMWPLIDNLQTYFINEEFDKNKLTDLLGNAKGTKVYEYFITNKDHILKLIENITQVPF
jgi:sugar-specific transcriptional regulator TrmB